jgi:hypothetical protein
LFEQVTELLVGDLVEQHAYPGVRLAIRDQVG